MKRRRRRRRRYQSIIHSSQSSPPISKDDEKQFWKFVTSQFSILACTSLTRATHPQHQHDISTNCRYFSSLELNTSRCSHMHTNHIIIKLRIPFNSYDWEQIGWKRFYAAAAASTPRPNQRQEELYNRLFLPSTGHVPTSS